MRDGRLTMASEPGACPIGVQVAPPSMDSHKPCLAIPAMTLSLPGTTESRHRLPHSEGRLARFPVTFTHAAGAGEIAQLNRMANRKAQTNDGWRLGGSTRLSDVFINPQHRRLDAMEASWET